MNVGCMMAIWQYVIALYFLPMLSTRENHVVALSIRWQVKYVSLGLPKVLLSQLVSLDCISQRSFEFCFCSLWVLEFAYCNVIILPVVLCIWWTFQWIVIKVEECVGRDLSISFWSELVPSFGFACLWWHMVSCIRWLLLADCILPGTANWVFS